MDKRWLWIALILLLAAGMLIPVSPLYRPVPSDDPSVYLYVGATVLNGGAPYHSAWDHKQPLAYLVYALGLLLAPHSLWGLWLIELTGLTAAGVLGFLFLERLAPRPVSFLAVAAGLLTLYMVLWGYSLEELALPFQMGVLYVFVRLQTAHPWRTRAALGLAGGVCAGAAFFLKQNLIAAALAVGLYLVLEMLLRFRWPERRGWRARIAANLLPLGGMAAGFALIGAPLIAYLWRAGALADYRDAAFGFNLAYAGLGPLEQVNAALNALEYMSSIPGLFLTLALWITCATLALLQTGPTLARAINTRGLRMGLLVAGAGLVALSLIAELVGQEPGFGMFQWLALAAGAALALAGGLTTPGPVRARLADALQGAPRLPRSEAENCLVQPVLWLAVLYFPIQLFLLVLSGRNYVYYFIPWVPFLILALGLVGGLLTRPQANRSARGTAGMALLGLGLAVAYAPMLLLVNGYAAPLHPPLPGIAAYVSENTAPGDSILAWGKDTTYIYFLTNRQAPTRYFYQAPVSQENYNNDHRVSAEIRSDMQANPPRLFLIGSGDKSPPPPGACPLPAEDQENTPGSIFQFVCNRYQYAATMDDFQVYRLKP